MCYSEKVVVAGEEVVLAASADLTEAAFGLNVELGLFVSDHALAGSILMHFSNLIDRGLLRALPQD